MGEPSWVIIYHYENSEGVRRAGFDFIYGDTELRDKIKNMHINPFFEIDVILEWNPVSYTVTEPRVILAGDSDGL